MEPQLIGIVSNTSLTYYNIMYMYAYIDTYRLYSQVYLAKCIHTYSPMSSSHIGRDIHTCLPTNIHTYTIYIFPEFMHFWNYHVSRNMEICKIHIYRNSANMEI